MFKEGLGSFTDLKAKIFAEGGPQLKLCLSSMMTCDMKKKKEEEKERRRRRRKRTRRKNRKEEERRKKKKTIKTIVNLFSIYVG